jgi:pentatricopeptide repeat protein
MKGLDGNVYVHSALLGMYGKLGTIADVEHVFARVSCFHHEIVPWNVMLSAYVDRRHGEKALRLFRQMQQEGISPDETSYATALQACCLMAEEEKDKSAALEIGVALHSDVRRNGFDLETSVCTVLVSMYARCERIREAEHLFEEALEHHDVVSWTSMLSMYVEMGEGEKALQLYVEMIDQGMDPNECTLVSAFQACVLVVEKEAALTKSLEIGRALLIEAFRKGFDQESLVIASAMMMFGKCGSVIEAESMFCTRSSSHTDTVLSNALLFVYMENGQDRLALEMFRQALDRVGGLAARTTKACINTATFLYVLRACTRVGSLELCYHIHFIIVSAGLDMDLLLTTMLVHAYGSFGSMEDAGSAFDSLPGPDIASWNSLLSGHARRGDLGMSARVLEEIRMLSSIKPNAITLLLILSMCSHVGHVASSLELLDSIDLDDGACLTREHWASAEDLMGRAGNLPGILSVLSKIPAESCPIPWLCLLASCSRHGNLELGKVAFDQMISLNTVDTSGAYISMSNMYMNS